MKVFNLLTSGNIGGIEVLCKDIGVLAPYDNLFCFVSGEGPIYEQMQKIGLNVKSLAKGKKFSLSKLRKLIELAETYDIIVIHHGDPFLRFYYCCLKKIYPSKKICYDSAFLPRKTKWLLQLWISEEIPERENS